LKVAGKASFFAVPTLVRRMLDPDFMARSLIPHIHKIIFGGAPMYMSDLKDALRLFGAERMWGAYGQGEAPCTITHLSSDTLAQALAADDDVVLASVGYPRTGVEVRVVDESDRTVPPGVVGEVAVAGDIVMKGYWNMPEASAATLAGGWLHTGDLGHMNENGLLTLVDRSKDMIIAGGSNIYPREIEEVLLQHPSVREAAVVGMADKDWGEFPVAFIVSSGELDQDSLESFCLERIGRYKRPRRYIFKEELPKSSYGKILKSALREQLLTELETAE
jgi:long-chain acyl-CoA synthetase